MIDKLHIAAAVMTGTISSANTEEQAYKICKDNLKQLKVIHGIIAHLELVIDEILKTRELR